LREEVARQKHEVLRVNAEKAALESQLKAALASAMQPKQDESQS
jgi:hypothetical protein